MALITKLGRLINGVTRNVDLSQNTLVVNNLQAYLGNANYMTFAGTLTANRTITMPDANVDLADVNKAILKDGSRAFTADQSMGGFKLINLAAGSANGHSVRYEQVILRDGSNAWSADQSMGGFKLTNLSDPGAAQDAATKSYVDGAISGSNEYSDSLFRIKDDGDATKKIAFQASGIATATTRTITMPNADVDLGNLTNSNISASAAIAYSKLSLSGSIVNADIASGAAIAYSKLSLSGSIVNADIASGAAIAESKLSLDYSTSSLNTAIGTKVSKSGDTMSGNLAMGSNKVTGLAAATTAGDAVRYEQAILVNGANPFTADQSMGSNKLTNVANGTNPNDAVNYSQLSSVVSGLVFQNPIAVQNMISDSLTTPPGSPTEHDCYLAASGASGGWTAGHVYEWSGTAWIDVLGRAIQVGDRFGITFYGATAAGGFVGKNLNIAQVTNATPGSYAYTFTAPFTKLSVFVNGNNAGDLGHQYYFDGSVWIDLLGSAVIKPYAGSALSYNGNTLNVQVDNSTIDISGNNLQVKAGGITNTQIATGAAIAYSKLSLANSILNSDLAGSIAYSKLSLTGSIVNADISSSAAIAYSKLSLGSSIVNSDISSSAAIAYSKLSLSGSIVNADISASAAIVYSKLSLANSIVNADIASGAAIAYSKLNLSASIVNADISASAAIAYSKLNLSNSIVAGDLTSSAVTSSKIQNGAVDETKLASSVAGAGLTGGAGSALAVGANADGSIAVNADDIQVASSPLMRKSMVAGESFASNTSFAVRFAISGETAGRVYKADKDATSLDKFYVVALVLSTSGASAGNSVTAIMQGTHTLGSADSNFLAADIGKAVFLTSSGAFSTTAPTNTNEAVVRIGMVEDVNKIFVSPQVMYVA